ncbi:LacI family DNA-binding transcriptional regulator [Tessaracoccus sp.]|uniref:LacI family DNA-binding transcriptional regulator n=1 Tax=Tessaracoccus sp. TaxID=1971211 RepID=UPI00260BA979|nr:LacI family DNA-binding transcriptional regulator [Tessaracoccus sp.]
MPETPTPEMAGRRPTMSDVARAAGVSRQLVSIVMRDAAGASESTRSRVLAVAAEMGYVPDDRARKLRQTEAKLIGITYELQQPFHGDVVEQIYLAAATTGYDVALSAVAPTRSEAVAVESLIRARCDAIVMLGPESSVPDMKRWAERIPVVAVARRIKAPGVAVVRGDDAAGMRAAVEYLAQLGHLRIAHIDGAEAPGSADRRASYRRTMRRLGLGELADVIEGGPEEKDGARGVQALLARPKPPTAVIAFNDRCASGVLQYANRTGVRIPGDLSVMGYDDSRLADFPHVQLTTVSQDAAEIARAAVDMALARIAGRPAQELVVRPRLVVRDTAAPPRPPLPAEMASTYDGTHAAPRS